jgi:hypothetical protein
MTDCSKLSPPGTGSPLPNGSTCGSKDGSGVVQDWERSPRWNAQLFDATDKQRVKLPSHSPTQSHALTVQNKRLFINKSSQNVVGRRLVSYNEIWTTVLYNHFIMKTMNFLLMKVPNEGPIWSTHVAVLQNQIHCFSNIIDMWKCIFYCTDHLRQTTGSVSLRLRFSAS